MAAQNLALPVALAWFLLAGPFLAAEAASARCKQQQVRDRKPSVEAVQWQEACLPLAVILGGCCGLVWWVLLIIYDVSQKGGQKGFPQISGEVEPEELKTTTLDYPEEKTKAEIKLDHEAAGKGNVESGPCPPGQQGPTTFWTYLERELERILLAVRCYRIIRQNPMTEEGMNTTAMEKPAPLVGDWQRFLAEIKWHPLTAEGLSSLPPDKQQPLTGERPSSPQEDKQRLLAGEGPSAPPKNKQNSQSRSRSRSSEKKCSPARGKKKSPNRARSRSRKRSPSSRCQRCCSSRTRRCTKYK